MNAAAAQMTNNQKNNVHCLLDRPMDSLIPMQKQREVNCRRQCDEDAALDDVQMNVAAAQMTKNQKNNVHCVLDWHMDSLIPMQKQREEIVALVKVFDVKSGKARKVR